VTTVSLVTGANRGIGLEVCRQLAEAGHDVVLTARDAAAAATAASMVGGMPLRLDVTDPASIDAAAAAVRDRYGRLDVLVNNAAIGYDSWQRAITADLAVVREAAETNLFGPWQMVQGFLPLLRASDRPRIVNVSSEAGSLAAMGGGTPAYTASKAALNALTRMLAAELSSEQFLVNAVCPGWVATDMGGAGGRPVSDGAASVVWAATLPDDGPTGGFFRDGRPLPW
jgi:NAD(P)-dependent dehydrogenase (short-subunit alcohol dehydrogenase family)